MISAGSQFTRFPKRPRRGRVFLLLVMPLLALACALFGGGNNAREEPVAGSGGSGGSSSGGSSSGGSSSGGNTSNSSASNAGGDASSLVGTTVSLQANELESNLIDIVAWGGAGGGPPEERVACAEMDSTVSPVWSEPMLNERSPGPDSSPGNRNWSPLSGSCACGLEGGNVSASLDVPEGDTLSLTDLEVNPNGCVFIGYPDYYMPRAGHYHLEVIAGSSVVLTDDFDVSLPEVVVGNAFDDGRYWVVGFRPGESVQVVYWVMVDTRRDVNDETIHGLTGAESPVWRYALAADVSTKADEFGYVVVETDINAQPGGIVGASGQSGEAFFCEDPGWETYYQITGCGPALHFAAENNPGDVIFLRRPGTLEDIHGDDVDSAAAALSEDPSCPGAIAPHMQVGQRGRTTLGGGSSTVWGQPNAGPEVTRIDPGTEFDVIGGPVCVEARNGHLNAWEVRLDNGVEGWLSEGYAEQAYWIQPWP